MSYEVPSIKKRLCNFEYISKVRKEVSMKKTKQLIKSIINKLQINFENVQEENQPQQELQK
jgi:hypothetical protein